MDQVHKAFSKRILFSSQTLKSTKILVLSSFNSLKITLDTKMCILLWISIYQEHKRVKLVKFLYLIQLQVTGCFCRINGIASG